MRFPIPQITIFVLVLHTALGCCWHHAHDCIAGCSDATTAVEHACPCESHEHDEHAPSEDDHRGEGKRCEGDHHRHEHDCEGDHCTFVRSGRSSEERGERSFDTTFLALDDSAQEPSLISARSPQALDQPASNSGPPLRSHLLLGILLI